MKAGPMTKRMVVHKRQGGVITMVVSLGILLLTTLVVFNVANAILMEQRIVNNDARSKQAFEAAEAGLTAATTYIRIDPDRNNDGVIDPVFDTTGDGIGDSDTQTVGQGSVVVTTEDLSGGDMLSVRISAQGFSDDMSATRTVTYTLIRVNPLPNSPENPLTSRGAAIVSGAATVHNPEGHSTIWSGTDVDLGSNNTTSTRVPDTNHSGYPACMDIPMTCALVSSSNRQMLGVDVIENDSSLGGLNQSEFFQNYFGMTPTAYRSAMATIDTTSAADAHLATHEVVWIEGDTTFNNATVGCEVHVPGNNTCPQANIKPSIVIVNGNASFSGTPKIYGLLFVLGNVNLTGNTTVFGALAAGGDMGGSGNLDIWYNSQVLKNTQFAGAATGSAGTWRDF